MSSKNNVYKDEITGTWSYYISGGKDETTGKRIQKFKRGFRTRKEAQEARTAMLIEMEQNKGLTNEDMLFKDFVEQIYVPEYRSRVEETTFGSREPAFEKMVDFFGHKKVIDITTIDVQRWRNELMTNYSQNYARLVYGMFSGVLEKMIQLEMIKKNPAKVLGGISKKKVEVEFWTKEEFEQVLATFNLDDYYEHYCFVVVWLYFMTGLRVNEATALRWKENIDLDKGVLKVTHSLRLKTKEDWELGPTKTRAGRRTISLDGTTVEVLKCWNERQKEYQSMEFVLSYDGHPSIKSTINRIAKRHAELAGVKVIQPKGLRHSHASLLINIPKANVLIVKERLGHEDIQTTLGTYSHLYEKVDAEVADALTGIIQFETPKDSKVKFNGNQSVNKVAQN